MAHVRDQSVLHYTPDTRDQYEPRRCPPFDRLLWTNLSESTRSPPLDDSLSLTLKE